MKKKLLSVSVILVLACAVVALYWYIDRSGKEAEEPVNTVAEQILARDMVNNYPPTPYAVTEFYCGIVECIYSADTTQEQLERLVELQRSLFDEEFAALNPYEELLETTKKELEDAKEKKLVFTGYILDKASNVTKWKREGKEYASLMFQLMSSSENGSGGSYRNMIMRKDSNGKYKILGWETAEGDAAAVE
ncbi:MAG: hypothetical protein IJZ55_06240 [Lachnospiraceae bacterium]|nr:hypothetical protein [Lachnospiraceae bacterium]